MSARLLRGFRRIGIVLAVVVFSVGALLSLWGAAQGPLIATRHAEASNCIFKRSQTAQTIVSDRIGYVDHSANNCPWEASLIPVAQLPKAMVPIPPLWAEFLPAFAGFLAMSAIAAGLIFGASAVLGWVLAGFSRD
jgi:hypothetical protein